MRKAEGGEERGKKEERRRKERRRGETRASRAPSLNKDGDRLSVVDRLELLYASIDSSSVLSQLIRGVAL